MLERRAIAALFLLPLAACLPAAAQVPTGSPATADETPATPAGSNGEPPAESLPPAPDAPAFFRLDYTGDWPNTPRLTGDWGGARTKLANDGVAARLELLQFLQGNANGGIRRGVEYFGSADLVLEFDTGRMGLWPGGYFKLRAETPWGRNANQDVGAVSNPNFDALFPSVNDPGLTTLTEAWYMQFLSEQVYVLAGKIDPSRLPGQNTFASDYYTQFMNTSLWQNPVTFTTIPYTTLTAGIGFKPNDWFEMSTLVMDSYGTPTRTGFDTAFGSPSGLTLLQSLACHYELAGLDGNQRLGVAWSSRERVALDDLDRLALAGAAAPSFSRLNLPRALVTGGRSWRPGRILRRAALSRLLAPETESGSWMISYDFDQYLIQESDDPTQGVGVFGRFGWSPGKLNPVNTFYSLGVGGKGVVPGRDHDRFGVGYYYIDFSDDLPGLFGVHSEQGIEFFYNIEVTPWLHITPDIQVILNPGGGFGDRDTALVYGLRTQMSL